VLKALVVLLWPAGIAVIVLLVLVVGAVAVYALTSVLPSGQQAQAVP
jgi:hypothetical protein